jgi:hypothetical protein
VNVNFVHYIDNISSCVFHNEDTNFTSNRKYVQDYEETLFKEGILCQICEELILGF